MRWNGELERRRIALDIDILARINDRALKLSNRKRRTDGEKKVIFYRNRRQAKEGTWRPGPWTTCIIKRGTFNLFLAPNLRPSTAPRHRAVENLPVLVATDSSRNASRRNVSFHCETKRRTNEKPLFVYLLVSKRRIREDPAPHHFDKSRYSNMCYTKCKWWS